MTRTHQLVLIFTLIFAFAIRLFGLNWDQNQHLHPDERFLTMVGNAITWPVSLTQYFDTATSPANPHNQKFDFYVYGTYPVLLAKALSAVFHLDDYQHLPLFGRAISAFLDTGVVFIVFLITRIIFPSSPRSALWAAFAYSVSVLPIQLSHFFAVDTYLVFFITLSFYLFLLIYQSFSSPKIYFYSVLLGICFGLGLGAKISGLIFLPTLALGFLVLLIKHKKILQLLLSGFVIVFFSYCSLRFTQPYLFSGPRFFTISLNPKTVANWKQLEYIDQPNHYYPPSTQWVNATRGLFPLENLILWGLGLPLAVFSLVALFYLSLKNIRHPLILLTAFTILSIFVYQSLQFSQPMRYFYPIYPFLAVFAGVILSQINSLLTIPLLFILLIWPVAFLSVYSRPHSRVEASAWIYQHLPPGSTLSCEYWDDCLPVPFPGLNSSLYKTVQLEPYAADTSDKWAKFLPALAQVDYLILSSNRLYASIMTDPQYYPQTNKFYQALFAGQLGFTKVAEFTSRPNLPLPFIKYCLTPPFISYGKVAASSQECPLPGLSVVDDYADETFTVYDHPKVIIFKNLHPGSPINFPISP